MSSAQRPQLFDPVPIVLELAKKRRSEAYQRPFGNGIGSSGRTIKTKNAKTMNGPGVRGRDNARVSTSH